MALAGGELDGVVGRRPFTLDAGSLHVCVEEGPDAVTTPEPFASCRSALADADRFDLTLILEGVEV